MPEWNEVSLQLLQAWVVVVAVGILLLSVLFLFVLSLLGVAGARNALAKIRAAGQQYVQYVDDPNDAIIKGIVSMAALTGRVKISPEDAARIVPEFIELLGKHLGSSPDVISKAD